MSYYDHATMIVLKLGIWGSEPALKPYQRECEAQLLEQCLRKQAPPIDGRSDTAAPGDDRPRTIGK